jgi:hypothetical protein
MLWQGFPYLCLLSGSDMVLPSSITEAIMYFKKKKNHKGKWRPNVWLGFITQ